MIDPEGHKILRFVVNNITLMRLRARFLYDDFRSDQFFPVMSNMYVEQDETMMKFLDELKRRYKIQKHANRKENIRLRAKGIEVDDLFDMSTDDINDIYDILEDNNMDFEL